MTNKCGPILLVEDNENDVFFMRRAFKRAEINNSLQVATDGQAAIDYLSGIGPFTDRHQFPLPCFILLDLKLPIKSGLEVLHWIRQQPQLRATVVVILTTSREPNDVVAAYGLGVNAFLVKPNDVSQLMQLVQALKVFWLQFNEFPYHHE
ncbi:MAG: response regulator receiver protein [Verrucomicrobiales bacterium]|nr:response regulator receiver protein [Verrucomicrobiales bacterium]